KVTVKSVAGKLASPGPSKEGDSLDITFSRPLEKLEYVAMKLMTDGAPRLHLEASGPGATARKWELAVAGDDLAHPFKTPLYTAAKGYDKVRIFPGTARKVTAEDVQVCRQMEGLLGP